MKRILAFILTLLILVPFYGCEFKSDDNVLNFDEMKNICELASVKCYFHNVAKFTDEARTTFLWMKKDAKFWIEYTATVTYGIDASDLKIEVEGNNVIIYLPEARLLGSGDVILNKDSYILDKNSAKTTAKDEISALSQAQDDMKERASNNTILLNFAREKTKELLTDYVINIGEALGKEYVITWIDADNNIIESTSNTAEIGK